MLAFCMRCARKHAIQKKRENESNQRIPFPTFFRLVANVIPFFSDLQGIITSFCTGPTTYG